MDKKRKKKQQPPIDNKRQVAQRVAELPEDQFLDAWYAIRPGIRMSHLPVELAILCNDLVRYGRRQRRLALASLDVPTLRRTLLVAGGET